MDGFRAALFTKLNGDAPLTSMLATTTSIYHRRAPGAAFAFILFQKQAGTPMWAFSGRPVDSQLWLIKGIDRSSSASKAEDISKRIDLVLTDPVMTLSDGTLLYLRRESDVDYDEGDDPDNIIYHVGGSYRTFIDRS